MKNRKTIRNRKAMIEMFGLIMILMGVAGGSGLYSKITTVNVAERSFVYQQGFQTYKDHLGADDFYSDVVTGKLIECLGDATHDLDNFCPNGVDLAALETCAVTKINGALDTLGYKYKTHDLPKAEIVSTEKSVSELKVIIGTEEPMEISPYGNENIFKSSSNPLFEETYPVTAGDCA
jgi:hypothetical protein